jgi:hypothetical protein
MKRANWRVVAAMAVLAAVGGQAGRVRADTVLFKGPPPLTQEMVDRTIHAAEWALGVTFTGAQRAEWKTLVSGYWRTDAAADMGGIVDMAELDGRIQAMAPAEREKLAQQIRPQVLEQFRLNAATSPEDKFLLGVYEAWNDRPLVPAIAGLPALTPSMLRDYASVMELAYDIRLDEAQRKMLDAHVLRVWVKRDKENIGNVTDWVAKEKELRAAPPGIRAGYGRMELVPIVIAQARKDAATDPEVRDLLAIHDEQHKPLAGGQNGQPALKRREAEAFLGVLFFLASKAEGLDGVGIQPPREVEDAWVAGLTTAWDTLPQENKAGFASMPDLLIKLQAAWDQTPADVRAEFTKGIGETPQGQEILARVREVKAADEAHKRELAEQRERSRAAAAAKVAAAKRGERPPVAAAGVGATAAASSAAAAGKPAMSDFAKASHDLAMERMRTQMISNMLDSMHQTRMMTIYNMGNGFTVEQRPR